MSDILLTQTLAGEPVLACVGIRALLRELLSTCALRPLMMYFLPYNTHKVSLEAIFAVHPDNVQPALHHTPGEC